MGINNIKGSEKDTIQRIRSTGEEDLTNEDVSGSCIMLYTEFEMISWWSRRCGYDSQIL